MLLEINDEDDVVTLETAIKILLGAQRHDVGMLRSKHFVTFKVSLLNLLSSLSQHDTNVELDKKLVAFPNEMLELRVVSTDPILVWCDVINVYI